MVTCLHDYKGLKHFLDGKVVEEKGIMISLGAQQGLGGLQIVRGAFKPVSYRFLGMNRHHGAILL